MEIQRSIIWDNQALASLMKALKWISNDSMQQAEEVEKAILNTIEIAAHYPERFPPDKFKRNNAGNFRAFETHSYRISYLF